MPLRPGPYDVPLGGGVSSTGARYSGRAGGESVVKGGGFPTLHRDQTLPQFFKNLGTVVGGLSKAYEDKQRVELDNEVLANYAQVVVGIDDINRKLREEGVRSGDYMAEWQKRVGGLVDTVHKQTSVAAQQALLKKVAPHLIEQRLKAGLVSDALLKDESHANVRQMFRLAEDQAANLLLPEAPLISGSKAYAFAFLEDFNEYVDSLATRGILDRDAVTKWKQDARQAAYFARAERLAHDSPEAFLERAGDASDPLVSNLDPNKAHQLKKRAEERREYLRRQRLQMEEHEAKRVKESQDRYYHIVFKGMEEAFQTRQDLSVYEGEIKQMSPLMGDENTGKALVHLRALQNAVKERDTSIRRPEWDQGYSMWLTRILSGAVKSPVDIHLAAGRDFDPAKADELVRAWFGKNEDDRKTEIEANVQFIKSQLTENIGLITKFNKQAALAEGRAIREFQLAVATDPTLRGSKLQQFADDLVQRYTQAIQTTIASPEKLKNSLPIVDGRRLETEADVIDAWKRNRILESQANEYIGLIRYIGSLPKKEPTGEAQGEKIGDKSGNQPLRTPKGKP